MKAPYRILEVDAARPLQPVTWCGGEGGAYLIVRVGDDLVGRTWLDRKAHPGGMSAVKLEQLIAHDCGISAVSARLHRDLWAAWDRPDPTAPSLSCAICTRDRPVLLGRCLLSVMAAREAAGPLGAGVEIIVVDNAPSNRRTADAVAACPAVRYVVERIPGLDFARNRAWAVSKRHWIAYFDDDTVLDRHWISAFAESLAAHPEAGAFTGSVLALALETEAQLRFEKAGGFFKGANRSRNCRDRFADPTYPCGAGRFGTGANMVFRVELLRTLGGFDEALDTGPPLPSAGDLDMFYRVLRGGHLLVYEPQMLVRHEHRRTMRELRSLYFTWGLGVATLLAKQWRADPAMRPRLAEVGRWYAWTLLRALGAALIKRRKVKEVGCAAAELLGLLPGYFGAYQRSRRRVARRRQQFAP